MTALHIFARPQKAPDRYIVYMLLFLINIKTYNFFGFKCLLSKKKLLSAIITNSATFRPITPHIPKTVTIGTFVHFINIMTGKPVFLTFIIFRKFTFTFMTKALKLKKFISNIYDVTRFHSIIL